MYVRCKTKKTVQMEQKESFCFEVNLQEGLFSPWSPIISLMLLCWWLKAITSGLFLTEIKPVTCPYVLPTPSVLLQTAWLRSSQRMGQCPLIRAQQPSCPGQVSLRPGAVPSMPWLVPDWIPPSNPFQRLFFFYGSGMQCDFPFPL